MQYFPPVISRVRPFTVESAALETLSYSVAGAELIVIWM